MEKSLLPRMSGWLVLVVVLLIAVWLIAPHQVPVSLYKLSLVTLAAVVGYWLDRSLFPYARPHLFFHYNTLVPQDAPKRTELDSPSELVASACMLRRAIIIAAAMIAVSLGA